MSKEKKAQKLQEKADKAAAKAEKVASKPKKSKVKIIGGIVVAILAIALIGSFLPECRFQSFLPRWSHRQW